MRSVPNSFVTQVDAGSTQLTYALELSPAPLTVSLSNAPVIGTLQFVATNPTASAIAVTSIAFTIQVGTASSNLTATTAPIASDVSDTTDWLVVGPAAPVTSGPAVYTLQPATGPSVTLQPGQSVLVQIYGFQTIASPGNTTISVKEMIGGTPAFTNFLVTTFPAGFFFNGLVATVLSGSTPVPVAQVNAGTAVTLNWQSSVVALSSFTIYYSNASSGQQTAAPSDIGEWTSPPLTSDTVFTIVVTVSIQGGQPLSAALSTAVSVQNPALIAASINAGTATVTGAASISGALSANAITATGVTVNGGVTVSGATALNGGLTASAVTTPGLSVSGTATVSTLIATALATLNGGLTASGGPVGMMTGAQAIGVGTYNANTDGFVVGYVYPSQQTWPAICRGLIFGSTTDGVSVSATGGTYGLFDGSWNKAEGGLNNSFMMPVRKGTQWSVSVFQDANNAYAAGTTFYWIPIGTATSAQTVERVGDSTIPVPESAVMRVPVSKTNLIPELIEIIDSLLPAPMPAAKRQALTAVLEKMNIDEYTEKR